MKVIIPLLVLLFAMCGAQTQSTQTEVQTDILAARAVDVYVELRELRAMLEWQEVRMANLTETLSFTQDELLNSTSLLDKMEAENMEQEMKLAAVTERLVASETKMEDLERVNAAQEAELTAVKTRLAASETEVAILKKETAAQAADLRSVTERVAATEIDMEHMKKDTAAQHTDLTAVKSEVRSLNMENEAQATDIDTLKTENAAQEIRLSASETEVENLKVETAAQEAELTAVKTRLAAIETDVVNLEKEITEQPKVAFSAFLTDSESIESGNSDLDLVFSKIITNVGQAYSSSTGFFTAPVRGVYYFRFTVMDHLYGNMMTIKMVKNGEQVMRLYDYDSDASQNYLSNGVTLQLEEGDVVNMQLPAGYRLFDNADNHSNFSGFLLFPL